MADDVDKQLDREGPIEEAMIRKAMAKAADIPKGKPGDCDLCGEWFSRLVDGACARCRDKYKLP